MADIEADVIVVGAGISGALLAAKLSQAGVKVAILEAGATVDRGAAIQRFWDGRDQGARMPLSAEPRGPSPDQQRSRLLVPEHLSQGGRRYDVALAWHVLALRAE
jgi:choline dehydrogenase-like flavoprotein